ncbi:hypothetical protein FALCPG4_013740 [Fusarium falciforme]
MLSLKSAALVILSGGLFQMADAQYKIGTKAEIKDTAAKLAYDLMLQYDGNTTGMIPGILPGPPTEFKGDYYWWEGGAMMGTYIDYWKLTGDSSYNHVIMEGMLHQTGDGHDYMPENHTASLGNDDQGFWGMSAMLAAENKFPQPSRRQGPMARPRPGRLDDTGPSQPTRQGVQWRLAMADSFLPMLVTTTRIVAIANGCFFNLGARLARYTGNSTYAKYAEETWDWLWAVEYIDHENWRVYDGGHVEKNCTDINKATFSYNAAILLQGAAFMYNYTNGSEIWETRVNNLTDSLLKNFFPKGIAWEVPLRRP